jgi:hypothetical protein
MVDKLRAGQIDDDVIRLLAANQPRVQSRCEMRGSGSPNVSARELSSPSPIRNSSIIGILPGPAMTLWYMIFPNTSRRFS